MKKTDFIARKKQIQEANINSLAETRNISPLEAKREWEREYYNPIKGQVSTFQKRIDLFAR